MRKGKALLRLVLAFAFTTVLLPLLVPDARADTVTDTIGIYVGYFGWPEEDYIEKVTYHWTELDDFYGGALDTHEEIYSYTNGSRTYLVAARGFYIRDLLQYAGIDFSSIASVDFFTKDHANGAYRSFTAYSLFWMPRYYFPNLAANEETGEIYPYDGDDIWNGATQVEAMLALEDFTEWDVPGAEFEQLYDPALLSPNCRFHLFFGQSQPEEASTSSAAKYCYKLLITFSGTPVLSTDETDLQLKIGSGHRLELYVDAEDGLLNDYVRSHITWSSSDERVVSVAPDGTITVHAAGDATVTAAFGEASVSVNVHVADEPGPDTAGQTGGEPGQTDGQGGQSEAPPSAAPTPEPPAPDAPQPAAIEPPAPETATPAPELPEGKRVLAIPAAALVGRRPGDTESQSRGGSKMDEDSVQLTIPPPERDSRFLIAAAALAAVCAGALFEIIRFRRALRGKRT